MDRVQFHKLLRKTPRIAAAVNIACFVLYGFQEVCKLLYGGRVCKLRFHLLCGHIGKISTPNLGKQAFLIAFQVTDKIREPQGESIPLVGRLHLPVGFDKPLA